MNILRNILLTFILSGAALVFSAQPAAAVSSAPNFPACSNPQGTLKISYADGQHAIVGESNLRAGSDAVYDLESGNVLQCFCSIDGSGVQTNWWKLSSLDQSDIDTLVKLGWYFIPNGADWGLSANAFMAKNNFYSCGGGTTTTSIPAAPACTADRPAAPTVTSIEKNGSSATITWTKVNNATHYTIAYGTKIGDYQYGVPDTGNVTSFTVGALDPDTQYYFIVYAVNDCMPSLPSTTGQVLGASTSGSVLGLATTGNIQSIIYLFTTGFLAILIGIVLKKQSASKNS